MARDREYHLVVPSAPPTIDISKVIPAAEHAAARRETNPHIFRASRHN